MDKLILETLIINKFRALNKVHLNFAERHNEITGFNGMGKSSILDCIRFMMTDRDDSNSKFQNFKTITKNNEEEFPNVELKINFKNKIIILKTEDNKWFINENKLNSRNAYLNALENILGVKQEQLVFAINPNILKDILSGKKETKNKDKVRSTLVGIANSISDKDKVMSQNDYDELNQNIKDLTSDVKNLDGDIKSLERRIENFKRQHRDIKDWDSPENLSELNKEENKLKNQKNLYSDISDQIYKKQSELKDLKNKKLELENSQPVEPVSKPIVEPKKEQPPVEKQRNFPTAGEVTLLMLLCLTCVFGMIYLFGYIVPEYWTKTRPAKRAAAKKEAAMKAETKNDLVVTENKKQPNNQNKIDKLQKEIDDLNTEIKNLKNNPNYKNVNVDNIVDRLNQIQSLKNKNEEIKANKEKMKELQNELSDLKALKNKKEKDLDKKEEQKKLVIQKTNEVMEKYFRNFHIDFFDENNNEILKVSKDYIPLDYLNYSQKMKFIFTILLYIYINDI
ncbi:MAG: hypothetical protein K2F52_01390 [Malacoplasma sp.]|nr:hypothetical protein [Malacoplasma sp.]